MDPQLHLSMHFSDDFINILEMSKIVLEGSFAGNPHAFGDESRKLYKTWTLCPIWNTTNIHEQFHYIMHDEDFACIF